MRSKVLERFWEFPIQGQWDAFRFLRIQNVWPTFWRVGRNYTSTKKTFGSFKIGPNVREKTILVFLLQNQHNKSPVQDNDFTLDNRLGASVLATLLKSVESWKLSKRLDFLTYLLQTRYVKLLKSTLSTYYIYSWLILWSDFCPVSSNDQALEKNKNQNVYIEFKSS